MSQLKFRPSNVRPNSDAAAICLYATGDEEVKSQDLGLSHIDEFNYFDHDDIELRKVKNVKTKVMTWIEKATGVGISEQC